MRNYNAAAFRAVLIIVGLYGVFLSLDFGVGGFQTLGWQGSRDFVQVADAARFGVQDNHFRFLSGMLSAASLFMIFAASNPQKYRQALTVVFALIFVGGLMRFTSGDSATLFSAEIAAALLAETVLMLGLYVWLNRLPASAAPRA